jgi:tartrate dehydrogenase/decarboxylase/D-malate dehydrogenase
MVWSAALMLQFLGEQAAHDAMLRAIEQVLAQGRTVTPDLGGSASTTQMGEAIAALI